MLMPIVAIMKVAAPRTTAVVLSIRDTISTGSSMYWPKTVSVPAVVITVTSEKARKLTGSPRSCPSSPRPCRLANREKSLKLTIGPEK